MKCRLDFIKYKYEYFLIDNFTRNFI